jgi:RHS repeat-associated protein
MPLGAGRSGLRTSVLSRECPMLESAWPQPSLMRSHVSAVLALLSTALGFTPVNAQTYGVTVTPDGGTTPARQAYTSGGPFGQAYFASFVVKNTGSTTNVYSLTCTGASNVTCTSLRIGNTVVQSVSLFPSQTATVNAYYSVGAPGTGTLTLHAAGTNAGDSGWYSVPVVATQGAPLVRLRNNNGDRRDQALCLTSGAGEAAGVACGDLFVVHSTPEYRTLGRPRSLTLHYSSASANGLFLLAADITQPVSAGSPTKVQVVLTVGTSVDSAEYPAYATGETRQVVVGRGLASQPTGVYPFTLRVRNVYTSGPYDTTLTGTALIVNRGTSEFGRGWSLLGVERILFDPSDTTRLIWVAGDASIRLYRKPTPSSNVFVAPAAFASDSLVRFDTSCTPACLKWYRHNLKHAASVVLDETGRHRETRSRVGQRTTFTWGSIAGQVRLQSVVVPPGSTYNLHWNSVSALLDSIVDPAGRRLRATVSGGLLTRLVQGTPFPTDDADTVQFEYDGAGRLTRRIAESSALAGGFVGTRYVYQNSARLTQIRIPGGGTGADTAVVSLTPWDEKGLAVAYANQQAALSGSDGVPTRVDGPLPGIGDAADVWVERFGAPTKVIQLGLSATTMIWRDSTVSLPALITRVQSPNGRIARMAYNARGNLTEGRDSTSHLGGAGLPTKVASYTYADANTPDSPTRVTDALGRHADYAYNSLGLTDSVVDTRGLRTKVFYKLSGTMVGLIDSVTNRSVTTWWESDASEHTQDQTNRFTYDASGNPKSWTSPVGLATAYQNDLTGAVTDVYDPIGHHRRWARDGFNRVTGTTDLTTQDSLAGVSPRANCDETQIVCDAAVAPFDPASDFLSSLVSVYRQRDDGVDSIADPRGVWRRLAYDAAGRVSRETDDFGLTRYAYTSAAGTLDSTISRSGLKVRFRYDSIGRRTAMLLPTVPVVFAPNDSVQGDSVSYEYDVMANLIRARNRLSTLTRTFFGDGSLQSQVTLYAADPSSKDSSAFLYDGAGARVKMVTVHGGNVDSVRYFYGATTGDLDSMRVWWGAPLSASRKVSFVWDVLGRRRLVTYPNGMTVTFRYDAGGAMRRLISRNRGYTGGLNDRFHFDLENDQIDPGGRILHQDLICYGWGNNGDDPLGNPCGSNAQVSTTNEYNLFGMLQRQVRTGLSPETQTRRYDRSGNLAYQHSTLENRAWQYNHVTHPGGGKSNVLLSAVDSNSVQWLFVFSGDLARRSETRDGLAYARYWYDALGRTSGVTKAGGTMTFGPNRCQYDPDGQMADPCETASPRLIFHGPNVVGTVATTTSDWRFIHGPGTDDPVIGLYRAVAAPAVEFYWVTDGGGRQLAVATPNGSINSTQLNQLQVSGGAYAGGTSSSYGFGASRFGTADIPTMSFFRNRVYDQESGRFTQEDPIGLAGGLNLYQYAGNSPSMLTDPFGLCVAGPGRDHYYDICGNEIINAPNGLNHDRHYLQHEGETYQLDRALVPGDTPYALYKEGMIRAALQLADQAPAYSKPAAAVRSLPGNRLDFKTQFPLNNPRSLWLAPNGMMVHPDVVSNVAWGFYVRNTLHMSYDGARTAAWIQGAFAGGESALDQWAIGYAYSVPFLTAVR